MQLSGPPPHPMQAAVAAESAVKAAADEAEAASQAAAQAAALLVKRQADLVAASGGEDLCIDPNSLTVVQLQVGRIDWLEAARALWVLDVRSVADACIPHASGCVAHVCICTPALPAVAAEPTLALGRVCARALPPQEELAKRSLLEKKWNPLQGKKPLVDKLAVRRTGAAHNPDRTSPPAMPAYSGKAPRWGGGCGVAAASTTVPRCARPWVYNAWLQQTLAPLPPTPTPTPIPGSRST